MLRLFRQFFVKSEAKLNVLRVHIHLLERLHITSLERVTRIQGLNTNILIIAAPLRIKVTFPGTNAYKV